MHEEGTSGLRPKTEMHGPLQSVLGEGLRLIRTGVVLGAALAVVLGRGLGGLLFEVESAHPLSLGAAAALFAAIASIACLLPAIRAARTDLATALHMTEGPHEYFKTIKLPSSKPG